jgi:formate dehydrogenase subunit gamma
MLDSADRLTEIIDAHLALEGPLLPILHAVQAEWGHVPEASIPVIARALNVGRAEVHGVVSFYHDFRSEPARGRLVKLCAAEACQAQGGRALAAEVRAALGLSEYGATADGRATVEPVYCLGFCANGPAATVDGHPIGRATAAAILAEVSA